MPYRTDIPGQVSEFQLRAIERVASLVPENGRVVEVGSLFGKSSYAWGASVHPSVQVHCIDPWEKNEGVRPMEMRYGVKYGIEQFKAYLADLPNVHAHQGYSPSDFKDWPKKFAKVTGAGLGSKPIEQIDLYYEDAVHTDPILAENLDFWSAVVKPGGIICGDDYRPRFPDVRNGAAKLAEAWKRELITVEHFWCLLPDESLCPGVTAVAADLRALAEEARTQHEAMSLRLRIGPRRPVSPGDTSEPILIEGRAYIESLKPWPARPHGPLRAGVRMVPEAEPGREILAALAELPVKQLSYDEPVDFTCTIPPEKLPPGVYRAVFDVHSRRHGWMINGDVESARGPILRINGRAAETLPSTDEDNAVPVVALGERIAFTVKGRGSQIQGDGWIGAERAHTWMRADRSELIFTVDLNGYRDCTALMMSLDVSPFVRPPQLSAQRLEVRVGERVLFKGAISKRELLSYRIPIKAARRGPIHLELLHPDFGRPIDFDENSTDSKPLALAAHEMWLTPVYDVKPDEAE